MKKDIRLTKVREIAKYMPAADVFAFFNNLLEAHKDQQTTQREIARIAAVKDVVLAEITNRYQLYHTVFDRVFDERKEAIDRHFDIIDRGIAAGDKQLILAGLEGLSRIVSSSPFANIQELKSFWNQGRG
jgi:hypothetical protein